MHEWKGKRGGNKGELNMGQVLGKRLTLIGSTLRGRPVEEKIAITSRFETEVMPKLVDGRLRPVIDTVPPAKGRMTTVARMCPLSTVSLADMTARTMRVQRFDQRGAQFRHGKRNDGSGGFAERRRLCEIHLGNTWLQRG